MSPNIVDTKTEIGDTNDGKMFHSEICFTYINKFSDVRC